VTRIGLVGAAGRTGRLVVETAPEFPDVELVAAVVSPQSPLLGTSVPGATSPLIYSSNLEDAAKNADVVIDFSTAVVSVAVAETCARYGKACLIATTGHSQEQRQALITASRHCPLLLASNTSMGVFFMSQLVQLASRLISNDFDVEISEFHHRAKRDAPSGTAKLLAEIVATHRSLRTITNRTETRLPDEIGIASLRGGDVPGDHTVYFLGQGERIEITHRAMDRKIFARGAIRLALNLFRFGPGFKTIEDLSN
jgi:4-hydroxy-tetrahydrodipicolinate reductase